MCDHTVGQLTQIWAPSARTQWRRLYIYIFSFLCLLRCSGIFLSYQIRFSQFWPRPPYPSMIHFRFFWSIWIFLLLPRVWLKNVYIYIYCSAEVKSGLRCIQWRIWWNPRFSYLFSQPHPHSRSVKVDFLHFRAQWSENSSLRKWIFSGPRQPLGLLTLGIPSLTLSSVSVFRVSTLA